MSSPRKLRDRNRHPAVDFDVHEKKSNKRLQNLERILEKNKNVDLEDEVLPTKKPRLGTNVLVKSTHEKHSELSNSFDESEEQDEAENISVDEEPMLQTISYSKANASKDNRTRILLLQNIHDRADQPDPPPAHEDREMGMLPDVESPSKIVGKRINNSVVVRPTAPEITTDKYGITWRAVLSVGDHSKKILGSYLVWLEVHQYLDPSYLRSRSNNLEGKSYSEFYTLMKMLIYFAVNEFAEPSEAEKAMVLQTAAPNINTMAYRVGFFSLDAMDLQKELGIGKSTKKSVTKSLDKFSGIIKIMNQPTNVKSKRAYVFIPPVFPTPYICNRYKLVA